MKIGLISDIHGNAIALDLCLKRLEELGVDEIYFLGDAVGYLPAAREVVDRLAHSGIRCQKGNHESMLLDPALVAKEREPIYRLSAARAQLDGGRLDTIAEWPGSRELQGPGYSLLLVHGSPESRLDGYVYPDSDLTKFHGIPYDGVVMGHTHYPFIRRSGGKVFVNAGSVGLPRDRGDLAAFAIFDSESISFESVRLQMDTGKIIAAYGDQLDDSVRACLMRPGTGAE